MQKKHYNTVINTVLNIICMAFYVASSITMFEAALWVNGRGYMWCNVSLKPEKTGMWIIKLLTILTTGIGTSEAN